MMNKEILEKRIEEEQLLQDALKAEIKYYEGTLLSEKNTKLKTLFSKSIERKLFYAFKKTYKKQKSKFHPISLERFSFNPDENLYYVFYALKTPYCNSTQNTAILDAVISGSVKMLFSKHLKNKAGVEIIQRDIFIVSKNKFGDYTFIKQNISE